MKFQNRFCMMAVAFSFQMSGCINLPVDELDESPSPKPISTQAPGTNLPTSTPTPTRVPAATPTSTPVPNPTATPAQQGSNICANISENTSQTLSCPSGKVITRVVFASYGTPLGSCGGYSTSICHAASSTTNISNSCLNQASCTLSANNGIFGDPCSGTFKKLSIELQCGVNTITPTPIPPTPTTGPTPTPGGVAVARFYVSTMGNDNNPGTMNAPFKSWEKLSSVMVAGDRAYIRGGTYRSLNKNAANGPLFNWQNLNGTENAKIEIFAYPGEKPILDFGDITPVDFAVGFQIQDSKYVHLKGLRITGLRQPGPVGEAASGFVVDHTTNSTFEQIEVDHIGGYGFRFVNGANDNLALNCDAHHLDDRYTPGGRAWQGANGFNITGGDTSTRVTFDGCRAWCISDDGFDFFSVNAYVTIKNSWAFWNGYECTGGAYESDVRTPRGDGMGYKLGPANTATTTLLRVLTNNLAFENKIIGFDQNSGRMTYQFYNNTSYKNGQFGYFFGTDPSIQQIFKNNLSYRDPEAAYGPEIQGSFNSWNFGLNLQDSHFMSLDSVSASGRVDGPRQAGGSLPNLLFLKPAPGSPVLNRGTNVNLPFSGSAPDLGAYESP